VTTRDRDPSGAAGSSAVQAAGSKRGSVLEPAKAEVPEAKTMRQMMQQMLQTLQATTQRMQRMQRDFLAWDQAWGMVADLDAARARLNAHGRVIPEASDAQEQLSGSIFLDSGSNGAPQVMSTWPGAPNKGDEATNAVVKGHGAKWAAIQGVETTLSTSATKDAVRPSVSVTGAQAQSRVAGRRGETARPSFKGVPGETPGVPRGSRRCQRHARGRLWRTPQYRSAAYSTRVPRGTGRSASVQWRNSADQCGRGGGGVNGRVGGPGQMGAAAHVGTPGQVRSEAAVGAPGVVHEALSPAASGAHLPEITAVPSMLEAAVQLLNAVEERPAAQNIVQQQQQAPASPIRLTQKLSNVRAQPKIPRPAPTDSTV
jgi:hypothetical protein